ncbi:MAG: hypothetical protein MRZ79_04165 [Bacteroidia bacterium]|nr:hypothetical protein [Bacteroidia bacterium]
MDKELSKWQKEVEELEIDLQLSEDEIINSFENHKNNLTQNIDSFSQMANEKLGETAKGLQTKLDELRVQLALGKAESKEAYEKQRTELNTALHNVSAEYDKVVEQAGETFEEAKEGLGEQLSKFQSKLDVFRLHFHLGMAEAKDDYEEKKKELNQELGKMKSKVKEAEEKGSDKWEDFGKEMGEAFSHFQGAIKKLFD